MYIGRRPDGTIYGAWSKPQPNDNDHPRIEEVPNDSPEYIAFRDRQRSEIDTRDTEIEDLRRRITLLELERRP